MEFKHTDNDIIIQKYVDQAERKKEYNKAYYQNKVKPKKEIQKHDLEYFKDRCSQLELELFHYRNNSNQQSQNSKLINDNNELNQQLAIMIKDNSNLRKLLDATRQRVYELMMMKSDEILPPIQNITL